MVDVLGSLQNLSVHYSTVYFFLVLFIFSQRAWYLAKDFCSLSYRPF